MPSTAMLEVMICMSSALIIWALAVFLMGGPSPELKAGCKSLREAFRENLRYTYRWIRSMRGR